jgi:hypothetical protein
MITDQLVLNLQETIDKSTIGTFLLFDSIIKTQTYTEIRTTDQINLKIQENLNSSTTELHKSKDALIRSKEQYSYEELINKFKDLSITTDNFLPDWYTLRYLQKESILDRASVARVAVALSNLLRLAVENEINEIHYVTLRIRKFHVEELNKDIFVITDY